MLRTDSYKEAFEVVHKEVGEKLRFLHSGKAAVEEEIFVRQINCVAKNALFAFEAYYRLEEFGEAEKVIKDWNYEFKKRIEKAVEKSGLVHLNDEQLQEIKFRLEKLSFDLSIPKFSSWSYSFLCKKISPLCSAALHLTRKGEEDCYGLEQVLFTAKAHRVHKQVWFYLYKNRLPNIRIDRAWCPRANDNGIAYLLNQVKELESLDISGCVGVSSNAFIKGHQHLKRLIANKTSITKRAIDKRRFPSIQAVSNDSFVQVVWLKMNEITGSITEADSVVEEEKGVLKHYFYKQQRLVLIKILRALQKERLIEARQGKLEELVVNLWRQCPAEEWKKKKSMAHVTVRYLFHFVQSDRNCSFILQEELRGGARGWKTEADFLRIQALFPYLKKIDENFAETCLFGVVNFFSTLIDRLDKPDAVIGPYGRGLIVEQVELCQKIMIALMISPLEADTANYLLAQTIRLLQIPKKRRWLSRKKESFPKLSLQTLEHTVAFAMLLRFKEQKYREKLLWHIYDHLAEWKEGIYYPLPKLVAGIVIATDIPPRDKHSQFAQKVMAYKGVFEEDVSTLLKDAYLDALKQGKLGGKSVALMEALESLSTEFTWQSSNTRSLLSFVRNFFSAPPKELL